MTGIKYIRARRKQHLMNNHMKSMKVRVKRVKPEKLEKLDLVL
jgi:hypothetical protein